MTYEFQNTLHRTAREMCDAIVYEWMTGGGMNSDEHIASFLAESSDEDLTVECIEGWGLNADWREERGIQVADIMQAVARFRDDFTPASE